MSTCVLDASDDTRQAAVLCEVSASSPVKESVRFYVH